METKSAEFDIDAAGGLLNKLLWPHRKWRNCLLGDLRLCVAQFLYFAWTTLDQPIIDLWGFRPSSDRNQRQICPGEGAWLNSVVPIFGEPWIVPLEFPLYQWCVAALVSLSGAPIDVCARIVSAAFTIGVLWPIFLLAKSAGFGRRLTLIVGALWLVSPDVVFFGRTSLIEPTTIFLSAAWLAFYVRFLPGRRPLDFILCLVFGVLAATVKVTGFAGFVIVGFLYTCLFAWQGRRSILADFGVYLFAGATVAIPIAALLLWGHYADGFLAENPLSSLLRVQNLTAWYFGTWDARWQSDLWDWTVYQRALPHALGVLWFFALYDLVRTGVRSRPFWIALALLAAYLSTFALFPNLHKNHYYYQFENALLVCAAAAVVVEALFRHGRTAAGYLLLAVLLGGQLWTFYTSIYFKVLTDDLHNHPYYRAGLAVKEATPPDSVIVVFGIGYGADLAYFADRRSITPANWFPVPLLQQVLFTERDRWFGGRKLGAVVDCSVYDNQAIGASLVPIRNELIHELSARKIEVDGAFYGATVDHPTCNVFVPAE